MFRAALVEERREKRRLRQERAAAAGEEDRERRRRRRHPAGPRGDEQDENGGGGGGGGARAWGVNRSRGVRSPDVARGIRIFLSRSRRHRASSPNSGSERRFRWSSSDSSTDTDWTPRRPNLRYVFTASTYAYNFFNVFHHFFLPHSSSPSISTASVPSDYTNSELSGDYRRPRSRTFFLSPPHNQTSSDDDDASEEDRRRPSRESDSSSYDGGDASGGDGAGVGGGGHGGEDEEEGANAGVTPDYHYDSTPQLSEWGNDRYLEGGEEMEQDNDWRNWSEPEEAGDDRPESSGGGDVGGGWDDFRQEEPDWDSFSD